MKFWVYKDERFRWVFDDAARHLAQEAFVAGMDTVIGHLARQLPDQGFGGITFHLDTEKPSSGGECLLLEHTETLVHPVLGPSNYYFCPQLGIRAWLCNSLYRYLYNAPERFYCWVEQ